MTTRNNELTQELLRLSGQPDLVRQAASLLGKDIGNASRITKQANGFLFRGDSTCAVACLEAGIVNVPEDQELTVLKTATVTAFSVRRTAYNHSLGLIKELERAAEPIVPKKNKESLTAEDRQKLEKKRAEAINKLNLERAEARRLEDEATLLSLHGETIGLQLNLTEENGNTTSKNGKNCKAK